MFMLVESDPDDMTDSTKRKKKIEYFVDVTELKTQHNITS